MNKRVSVSAGTPQMSVATVVAVASCISATQSFAAGAGESSGGLPQLDLTTWPNQLFWLAVTFSIGYILMAKLIAPRIGSVIESRKQTVTDDLSRAKQADSEAQQMKQSFEAALEDARTKAAEEASQAMVEAKAQAEAAEAELSAKLTKKAKAAETKLAKLRDEAMANIDDVAKELTQDAVLAVTGMKINKTDAGKALKAVSKTMTEQEA
ncbi:F0F1-type ATP synthase, beta subunit [SAR116 cluster alpha proteobacterium HIMB100]|nr:F0F1-type ATP synthase, beta subunit [SAR116 cluster alpha proteobacterium HIMB100]